MAALNLSLCFVFVLFHIVLLHPQVVHCGDADDLLQGLNSFRTSVHLPPLSKNQNAKCLAGRIADELEDQKCNSTNGVNATPKINSQLVTEKHLKKCDILANSTTDGVIMPVCVHKRVPTLVLTNYTYTHYDHYLNNSKYTGAGVSCEDDWTVVILTTDTARGNFTTDTSTASLVSKVGLGYNMLVLSLGLLVYLGY